MSPARALSWASLTLLLASAGCTVSAVSGQDDPRPNNSCQSDSDCSTGNCGAGVCQAVRGQLEALLVSVSPPTDSTLPHLTFVTRLDDVPTSGGVKDVELAEAGHVLGSLVIADKAKCYPTFVSPDPSQIIFQAQDRASLPVQVSFELRERLLGVPQQRYLTSSTYDQAKGAYTYDVRVPAGEYDVYLVPPVTLADCPIPPQLRRGWIVEPGNYAVPFAVAPVLNLTLHLRWPVGNESLTGWQLDIIEPVGGKVISTVATLGTPTDGPQTVDYVAYLSYSEVVEPEGSVPNLESANDLLRLRPPAGVVAPTVFFDRSALGLFNKEEATLRVLTRLPKPVEVEAQVARADSGAPVRGTVTLISTEISGVDTGVIASYRASATIDEQGVFRVELPPGKYRVQAVPPFLAGELEQDAGGAAAAYETEWEIPADIPFQAGKLLELPPLNQITGQSRFPGAQVRAVATPLTVLPFDEALGKGDFLPRAASGLVDPSGNFTLLADPGRFDISVQAPDSLGFAWYVRPGVAVADSHQDLGRVTLPTPVALTGTATVGKSKVPVGAGVVRAYAYLDKQLAYTRDPKDAFSVVQVAETRTDDDGAFRLLLPSSITAPK